MPAKKVPKPFIYEEEMSFLNDIRVQEKQEGNLESSGEEDEGDDHAALALASEADSAVVMMTEAMKIMMKKQTRKKMAKMMMKMMMMMLKMMTMMMKWAKDHQ